MEPVSASVVIRKLSAPCRLPRVEGYLYNGQLWAELHPDGPERQKGCLRALLALQGHKTELRFVRVCGQ